MRAPHGLSTFGKVIGVARARTSAEVQCVWSLFGGAIGV